RTPVLTLPLPFRRFCPSADDFRSASVTLSSPCPHATKNARPHRLCNSPLALQLPSAQIPFDQCASCFAPLRLRVRISLRPDLPQLGRASCRQRRQARTASAFLPLHSNARPRTSRRISPR